MTFTYSNDPNVSAKDKLRFLLHDTDSTDVLLSDEEIAWMITEWGPNIYDVARACAETLTTRFIRLADSTSKTVGDMSLSVSYSQKSQEYKDLAISFLARRLRKSRPRIGVNADALKNTDARTTNEFGTDFHLGQMDNPNNPPAVTNPYV